MAKGRLSRTGARALSKKVLSPSESRNAIVREKVIDSLQKPLPAPDKPKREPRLKQSRTRK